MLLAAGGHDVLLLDRADFPSDTLSTHALARTGMVQLQRWGLLGAVLDSGAPPIREVVFHSSLGVTARRVKDRHGIDHLIAPRRHILDPILQQAAVARGARLRTGVTVEDVRRGDDGRVVGVIGRDREGRPLNVTARVVVGADGLRSRIARVVGASIIERQPSSGATHYAYYTGPWPAMEYFVGAGAFAGIFPTHDGEACVWVCSPDEYALAHRRTAATPADAFDAMVRATSEELAVRLQQAVRTSGVRGMLRAPNHVRQPGGPGWALVGDAGYHRDPITGHGISDAFRDAELLAEAIDLALRGVLDEATALRNYQRARDEMLREIFAITCELSRFPPADRFVELQRQLSGAIDDQSARLAARPVLTTVAAGA
jgi:flavin-dependent dehydrogenase